jgi:ribosomal protein S18 acetylase RimI-like enzyme
LEDVIFRKAKDQDMNGIMELQVDVFEGEQGIPASMIPLPAEYSPQWWCAILGTTIVGAVVAWEQNGQIHWGRFAIDENYRGLHIGTRLAEYSIKDLFSQGIQEINMEAREITVKIICDMGGKITGNPMLFYNSTVTPMVLRKEDFKLK